MFPAFFIAWLATIIHCHQGHVIAYLREENRILKSAPANGGRFCANTTRSACRTWRPCRVVYVKRAANSISA